MVEDKLIPTKTNVSVTGNSITIHTYYSEPTETFLQFFIANTDSSIQGVNFTASELGYTYENVNDIFELNKVGELVVSGAYVDRYSIDSNGDLIYIEQ